MGTTPMEAPMESKQLKELLLQALEHEMGGVKVYQTALKCVQNEELQEEWERYEQETEACRSCTTSFRP
jgi:rubrerythrin